MSSETQFPGTVSASGWTNPNNMKVDDGSYAVDTVDSQFASNADLVEVTNFGFSAVTGTILGIEVEMQIYETGIFTFADGNVRLMKAGSAVGSNYNNNGLYDNSSPGEIFIYGGPTDLWGTTWSPSDITNSGFGFHWLAQVESDNGNQDINIDYIKITVYYTTAAPSAPAFLLFCPWLH